MKLIKTNRYPGNDYFYIYCDVCGSKIRARDAVLITDKYNTLNRMAVCKHDADKTNPQQFVRAVQEKQIRKPYMVRSEPADTFGYINIASEIETGDVSNPAGRTPSGPTELSFLEVTSTTITLRWLPPDDPGSSAIGGYKVERESPVGGGFSTIVADTSSIAGYYQDTGLSASTEYNYRVSAINDSGTGSASDALSTTTSSS